QRKFQADSFRLSQERRQEQWTFGFILIILTLLAIAGYFYTRLRFQHFSQQLRSRLRALTAQMNPHFISNCLNAIEGLISSNQNHEASSYLTRFAKVSRMVLGFSQEESICLFDEIEMLTYYLQLEDLRLRSKLNYQIQVDQSLDPLETYIPPMMIQPFVENAIWHGIKPKESEGQINIQFLADDKDAIICIIEDDGIGREESRLLQSKSLNPQISYSTQIIEERINVLEQQLGAGLRIIDLTDENGYARGTRIELRLGITTISELS
ncbi:MAG: histidine kinase, partial [Bacteroidota bacterium]